MYGVTFRRIFPPYVEESASQGGDESSPLTYRTPDLGDPEPTSGVNSGAVVEAQAATRSRAPRHVEGDSGEVCPYHEWTLCDADCKHAPEPTTHRKRTA